MSTISLKLQKATSKRRRQVNETTNQLGTVQLESLSPIVFSFKMMKVETSNDKQFPLPGAMGKYSQDAND